MEKSIVGREKEKAGLKEYMLSERSEFIAIYGRRRVGKTFLVDHGVGSSDHFANF